MNFKLILNKVTSYDILEAYIQGFLNPVVNMSNRNFAEVIDNRGFGDISTNVICKLCNIDEKAFVRYNPDGYMDVINYRQADLIGRFEMAILWLAAGNIVAYNFEAILNNFPYIDNSIRIELNTLEDYKALQKWQLYS